MYKQLLLSEIFLLHLQLTSHCFCLCPHTMITLQNTGSNITLQTIAASGLGLDVVILLSVSQLRVIFSMIATFTYKPTLGDEK